MHLSARIPAKPRLPRGPDRRPGARPLPFPSPRIPPSSEMAAWMRAGWLGPCGRLPGKSPVSGVHHLGQPADARGQGRQRPVHQGLGFVAAAELREGFHEQNVQVRTAPSCFSAPGRRWSRARGGSRGPRFRRCGPVPSSRRTASRVLGDTAYRPDCWRSRRRKRRDPPSSRRAAVGDRAQPCSAFRSCSLFIRERPGISFSRACR